MKNTNLFKDLNFNTDKKIPRYLKIVNSVIYNITKGYIKMGEKLPSINVFSKDHKVSRDTVEKAYEILKQKNIIASRRGKGYYITSTKLISKIKILFLMNKLSPYKLKIYHAFVNNLGNNYHVDFEIYNSDQSLFLNLMDKNKDKYNYYVIMPNFKNVASKNKNLEAKSLKSIESIPKEKLIIMDNNELSINGDIVEIYQDFENDIYNALKSGISKIKKYKRLSLVLSSGDTYPHHTKIHFGFLKFCNEHLFNFKIVNKIEDYEVIKSGDLFVVLTDDDLVKIIDLVYAKGLVLGKDVGVLSYNETPFKRLLDIAVISTNFPKMGETAADMIINNKKAKIKNEFEFIDRNSI
jgi:DNA-binding transcriptional regulator YhcF (GntR family)